MNITDFTPGDIAGFSLAGYKIEPNSIKLMSDNIIEIPTEITCNKTTYYLENVVTGNDSFINIQYC